MNKIILIDGNNLAMRHAFAHSDLSVAISDPSADNFNPDNMFDRSSVFPTGVLHGFLTTIISLKEKYSDAYVCVVWDKGYKYRTSLTVEAVSKGIVKDGYKEQRKRKPKPKEVLDMKAQLPILQDMLKATAVFQFAIDGEEADDIIASYAKKYSANSKVLIVSNDKDFYQLLSDNIAVYRNDEIYTKKDFMSEYDVDPSLWVEIGALSGDPSDNIFSPPGWGEVTAINAIKQYGSCESVINEYKNEMNDLRNKYPDIDASDSDSFDKLKALSTESNKPMFPDVWKGMPFSGLALAVGQKLCKTKVLKSKLVALMYEDRIWLARKLKQMNLDIAVNEFPENSGKDPAQLISLCDKYKLSRVAASASVLCSDQKLSV